MKKSILMSAPILEFLAFRDMNFKDKRVVLAGGAFDILHVGHIEHLESAKSNGDILVVQITGDKRYLEKRGYQPMIPQVDRAKIIAAIRFVDYVFISNAPHFHQEIVDSVRPDVIFFNEESFRIMADDYVKNKLKFSGKIIVDNLEKSNSSSDIRKKIKDKMFQ